MWTALVSKSVTRSYFAVIKTYGVADKFKDQTVKREIYSVKDLTI